MSNEEFEEFVKIRNEMREEFYKNHKPKEEKKYEPVSKPPYHQFHSQGWRGSTEIKREER